MIVELWRMPPDGKLLEVFTNTDIDISVKTALSSEIGIGSD